jgi:ribonuclease E
VINQTEALVAIDVNSGRSTRERSIESTALKTNLEAAEEAARQMRLRDLAGLVVLDFIDMEENRNDRAVEKKMKDALRFDRARVQMGKISGFGLLEISRQRRRTGVLEGSSHICPTCDGTGRVRSPESASLQALRSVEAAVANRKDCEVALHADIATALYLLNEKRDHLTRLVQERGLVVRVFAESDMTPGQYRFEIVELGEELLEDDFVPVYVKIDDPIDEDDEVIEDDEDEDQAEADGDGEERVSAKEGQDSEGPREGGKRRRRRRRGGRRDEAGEGETSARSADGEVGDTAEGSGTDESEGDDEAGPEGETPAEAQARRRRRRGRRGGRRRREGEALRLGQTDGQPQAEGAESAPEIAGMETIHVDGADADAPVGDLTAIPAVEPLPVSEAPAKRKRPSRKKSAEDAAEVPVEVAVAEAAEEVEPIVAEAAAPAKKAPAKRAPRGAKAAAKAVEEAVAPVEEAAPVETEPTAAVEALEPAADSTPAAPRKSGWWSRNAQKLFGN